jgi:chloramphenicol O-acetyltransferase
MEHSKIDLENNKVEAQEILSSIKKIYNLSKNKNLSFFIFFLYKIIGCS